MPSELTVHATHRGGMRIDAACNEHLVEMDYPTPVGVATLRYEDAQERHYPTSAEVATVRNEVAQDRHYPMPADGACEAFTPLQLLLASLAGCAGNTMALLLARTEQPVKGIEVTARGQRRDEHPTVITQIDLEFTIRGEGIDEAAVERCLTIADQQLCPVWAMLKPGTPISASFAIVPD